MNNITFREADLENREDAAAIIELLNGFGRKSAMGRELPEDVQDRLIEELIAFGNALIFFAQDGEHPIGIATTFKSFSTFKSSIVLNIHDFFIDSEYQGRGIGAKFLNYIEEEAKKRNFCRLTLEVYSANVGAIALYERLGFSGTKGKQMYAMSKDIL